MSPVNWLQPSLAQRLRCSRGIPGVSLWGSQGAEEGNGTVLSPDVRNRSSLLPRLLPLGLPHPELAVVVTTPHRLIPNG